MLVLPLFGSLIGASVPVLLGFLLYRHQKRIDRKEALFSEKRLAYQKLLSAYVELLSSDVGKNGVPAKEVRNYIDALANLYLFAPREIAELGSELLETTMNRNRALDNEKSPNAGQLIALMKKDLGIEAERLK